jgi:hypothetical protein
MGTITRSLSNNITTGGVILPAGITNASVSAVTSFANASGGTLFLLSTQTASNSATISFTTGLDSTYDAYEFHFINIKPATDGVDFHFQGSTNGGSSYGVAITSSYCNSFHNESGSANNLSYEISLDLAQSTSYQAILNNIGNGADENGVGTLQLFNPSSTTYVKHFIGRCQNYYNTDYSIDSFIGGYFNTTSAINAIQFKCASGNISDGIIKLYGVKKS